MRMNGGKLGETRSSALWGTGNRGGDSRSNALWGKGGRNIVTAFVAMLSICVPLAASSTSGGNGKDGGTYIAPVLQRHAKAHPSTRMAVIISVDPTFDASKGLVRSLLARARVHPSRDLALINGLAVDLPARQLDKLADISGLTVTPDAPVHVSGYTSNQLWPYESGLSRGWSGPDAPAPGTAPTIAVLDSGIQAGRADFGGRVLASVNLSTLPTNSGEDGRGHGTFVAGIAAGGADGYTGATPQANLVSVDVMDDNGIARTSDVIAGCQWVLANKAKYNIRIANLSLHSGTASNFTTDPLDKAVEKLWFGGVVVVAAAGNYGSPTGPSGVLYAPGNDPFVITVGAIDIGGTKNRNDDLNAPWSAYGRTLDGFMKPDIAAPGRYMVGPVPATSTLAVQRADKITAPGYIQLSGTSFAAPVIAGAAAQILAKHPTYTPDQVKGALMLSAKPVDGADVGSVGVGEIQMSRAALVLNPPNPNKALDRFVVTDPLGASMFDAVSWSDAAKASVSWDSVSWDSVSWQDASWNVVSWQDVSWDSVSWHDVSWNDVSWADVSWNDTSYEDAAEGDANHEGGYDLTPGEAEALLSDPELAPPVDALPPAINEALAESDPASASSTTGSSSP